MENIQREEKKDSRKINEDKKLLYTNEDSR